MARTPQELSVLQYVADRDGKALEIMPNETPEQVLAAASLHAKVAQHLVEPDALKGIVQSSIDPVKCADNAVHVQHGGGNVVLFVDQPQPES